MKNGQTIRRRRRQWRTEEGWKRGNRKRTLSWNHEPKTISTQFKTQRIRKNRTQIKQSSDRERKNRREDAKEGERVTERVIESDRPRINEKLFKWLLYFIVISFETLNRCRALFSCGNSSTLFLIHILFVFEYSYEHVYTHTHEILHWKYISTIMSTVVCYRNFRRWILLCTSSLCLFLFLSPSTSFPWLLLCVCVFCSRF